MYRNPALKIKMLTMYHRHAHYAAIVTKPSRYFHIHVHVPPPLTTMLVLTASQLLGSYLASNKNESEVLWLLGYLSADISHVNVVWTRSPPLELSWWLLSFGLLGKKIQIRGPETCLKILMHNLSWVRYQKLAFLFWYERWCKLSSNLLIS